MQFRKVRAFVLYRHSFSASSQIVEIFTLELGKISILSHSGKKKNHAQFLELLNELELVLISPPRSSLEKVQELTLISSAHSLRNNLTQIYCLYYWAEFLKRFLPENDPIEPLYWLLRESLQLVKQYPASAWVLLRSFQLKSLKMLGFLPSLENCSECGVFIDSSHPFVFLSKKLGWLLCFSCGKIHSGLRITNHAHRFLMDLLELPIEKEKLSQIQIDPKLKKELSLGFENLIVSILGKPLHSAPYFNSTSFQPIQKKFQN